MPVGSPRRSLVEKLPSVQMTRGSISSTWRVAGSRGSASISLGLRVAVAGRPALEHVRDEHVARAQPDLAQQLVEQLAGLADERQALACPRWRPAPRRRTSGRRRRCRPRRRRVVRVCEQRAARAGAAPVEVDLLERLAALARRLPRTAMRSRGAATATSAGRHSQRPTDFSRLASHSRPVSPWGTGTGTALPASACAARSSAPAAWAPRWPPRCARPASTVDGPLGRGADGAGADVVLLCVPDGEIAAAAARDRARAARRPLLGRARRSTSLGAARGASRCTR